MPEPTKDMLVLAVTLVSAPLYVFFGWLCDRVGRKPVMLGGMLLALAAYYPGFHGIAAAANPALVEAQARRPVKVHADPATCSVQFDPAGTRRFDSSCDIAKSLLASTGISYQSRAHAGGQAIDRRRRPADRGARRPRHRRRRAEGAEGGDRQSRSRRRWPPRAIRPRPSPRR